MIGTYVAMADSDGGFGQPYSRLCLQAVRIWCEQIPAAHSNSPITRALATMSEATKPIVAARMPAEILLYFQVLQGVEQNPCINDATVAAIEDCRPRVTVRVTYGRDIGGPLGDEGLPTKGPVILGLDLDRTGCFIQVVDQTSASSRAEVYVEVESLHRATRDRGRFYEYRSLELAEDQLGKWQWRQVTSTHRFVPNRAGNE